MSARTMNTTKYIHRPFKGPSPPKQKIIVFSVLYLLIKLDDVFFSKWLTKEILDVSYLELDSQIWSDSR